MGVLCQKPNWMLAMTILLNNASTLLAVVFFLTPILYKKLNKEATDLPTVAKCAISAMALPDLAICIYYLFVNPVQAYSMPEAPQYFFVAIVIFGYFAFWEIRKILKLGGGA